MKRYQGTRTIDGLVVTVDGEPLDPRFDIHIYEDRGFEWSYVGSAPMQLALAILADHLENPEQARAAVESFTEAVIANLDNDWELGSDEIDAALA